MQLTPAFIDDPYPLYAQLLHGPRMLWTELWDGAWLVARYDDVIEVLRSPGLSAQRADHFASTLSAEQLALFAPYIEAFGRWMLFLDPPRHTELRRPLNKPFVPSSLARWQPVIQETADALIDAAVAAGEADFVRDIARPYPARIIVQMLGLDVTLAPALCDFSDDVAALFGSPVFDAETAIKAQKGLMAIHAAIEEVLPARRAERQDDLISVLIGMEEEGIIDEASLVAQCANLLFGGQETVRRALGNGLAALLADRSQWEALCADVDGMINGTVREVLRYDSPVQVSMRTVEQDAVVLDQKVEAGQRIATLVGAGNRDPRKFRDPDRFDITRDQGTPLTFGFGPHACIGAAMGRMEMRTLYATLARKAPGIELLESDPPRVPNPVFRGHARMPIKL